MKGLNPDFIVELFKMCLRSTRVLESAMPHLEYSYLPSEEHKEIWSTMVKYYNSTNKLPTIGILSQEFNKNIDVLKVISDIKDAQFPDKDSILNQLTEYIKSSMFYEMYEKKLPDLYNAGKKEEAYNLMKEVSEKIANFSVKGKYYSAIYKDYMSDYDKMRKDNLSRDNTISTKVPTGIDQFDDMTFGGVDKGDTFIVLAQSGVGKSKMLKYIGFTASKKGLKGLHVSAEETLRANKNQYMAAIAGHSSRDVENTNLTSKTIERLKKSTEQTTKKGGGNFYRIL